LGKPILKRERLEPRFGRHRLSEGAKASELLWRAKAGVAAVLAIMPDKALFHYLLSRYQNKKGAVSNGSAFGLVYSG